MKTGKPIQEMIRLLLGLAIVAAITIAIITILRGPAPGSVTVAASPFPTSSPQQPTTLPQEPTTEAAYPAPVASAVLPSPESGTLLPIFVQDLQEEEEALKDKNLSNEMRHSFETKVAIDGSMATQWAIYKKATPIPPTYEIQHFPTSTFPVGLQEGGTVGRNL
jgi:hypothetical protein